MCVCAQMGIVCVRVCVSTVSEITCDAIRGCQSRRSLNAQTASPRGNLRPTRKCFHGGPLELGQKGTRTQTSSRSSPHHPRSLSYSVSQRSCWLMVWKSGRPSGDPVVMGGFSAADNSYL